MTSRRTMKSNDAQRNWREVQEYVNGGGIVIVEHYNRPKMLITRIGSGSPVASLPDAGLLAQHLAYGVGGHEETDQEVWRRFPGLARMHGQIRAAADAHVRNLDVAGELDLDALIETPGQDERIRAYEAEVARLMAIPE